MENVDEVANSRLVSQSLTFWNVIESNCFIHFINSIGCLNELHMKRIICIAVRRRAEASEYTIFNSLMNCKDVLNFNVK